MNLKIKLAIAALVGAASIAITTTSASAWIVCNREGECWHTHHRYMYHPEYGIVVHPDGWVWGANEHYVWHEHPGRGYWHGGVWIAF